jgi:hypothetical protein
MTLKVIGAGFGRTGTLSLKLALEELGLGPCYHMIETIARPEHDDLWLALARGETSDWRPMLDGYTASIDWPGLMIWEELAAAYPDAKIILTVRDPDAWFASAAATIFARMEAFHDGPRGPAAEGEAVDAIRQRHMAMVKAVVMDKSFGGRLDKAHAIGVFNAHNAKVRRLVPPERLLVYEAAQGWAPLCAFLGVPVPATLFPKANSTEEFRSRFPTRR